MFVRAKKAIEGIMNVGDVLEFISTGTDTKPSYNIITKDGIVYTDHNVSHQFGYMILSEIFEKITI